MGIFALILVASALVAAYRYLRGDRTPPTPEEREHSAAMGRAIRRGFAPAVGSMAGQVLDLPEGPPPDRVEEEGQHTLTVKDPYG